MGIFTNSGIKKLTENKGICLIDPKHIIKRELMTWTTKAGEIRYIKELSDSHLNNILPFILNRIPTFEYLNDALKVIQDEIEYRIIYNITVPNYE